MWSPETLSPERDPEPRASLSQGLWRQQWGGGRAESGVLGRVFADMAQSWEGLGLQTPL